jgi:hypothetical protein
VARNPRNTYPTFETEAETYCRDGLRVDSSSTKD